MSELFSLVEGAQIILNVNGVFCQRDVYRCMGRIYAEHTNGFVRIGASSSTSNAEVTWEHVEIPKYCNIEPSVTYGFISSERK